MATTPALLAYLRGLVPLGALPDTLSFDDTLWQVMDDLWQRSVARIGEGIVVEWGGLLEIRGERLHLVSHTSGTSAGLRLPVPPGSFFVGSFHTHPDPHGYTGIGFSGADFADAFNRKYGRAACADEHAV